MQSQEDKAIYRQFGRLLLNLFNHSAAAEVTKACTMDTTFIVSFVCLQ